MQQVKNDQIIYKETHPVVFISGFVGGVLVIMFIILSLSDDGWDLNEVWLYNSVKEIKCYEEEGKFIYIFQDRLICKKDYIINDYQIKDYLADFRINGKNLYPKYEAKTEKRDRLIDKLLK